MREVTDTFSTERRTIEPKITYNPICKQCGRQYIAVNVWDNGICHECRNTAQPNVRKITWD